MGEHLRTILLVEFSRNTTFYETLLFLLLWKVHFITGVHTRFFMKQTGPCGMLRQKCSPRYFSDKNVRLFTTQTKNVRLVTTQTKNVRLVTTQTKKVRIVTT